MEMAALSKKLRCAPAVATNLMRRQKGGKNKLSLRTKSREFAMQMLFQWDMSQQEADKLEVTFWKGAKAARADPDICESIV